MSAAAAKDVGDPGGGSTDRPREQVARQVMRPATTTVGPADSLARGLRLMESLGTRELPVTDGRVLVGILTRVDLEPYRGHFEWTTVAVAMSHDPVTIGPDAPIDDVVKLLLEHGFNSVPVCAGGELLGMIARADLLRALAMND